jgi:uncharacterized protein (TIGR00645 family)
MVPMDRLVEAMMLGLRWLLLPLYVGLLLTVVAIYVIVAREIWHLVADILVITDTDVVLLLCSVLDLVLLANLVVMVGVASYESFISRIEHAGLHRPEWLGKLDSSNVKVKVAVSVVMISMVHLLRWFMEDELSDRLLLLSAVQIVFIVSAIGIALIDRASRTPPH